MAEDSKAMLIGVDGLPPRLLETLGEQLPTLGRLLEEGCWGYLRSTIPYTTAPAWTSMVTGAYPGEHGIYDFLYLDDRRDLRVTRGSDCRVIPLWRRLQEVGLSSIIINVPPFYPAEAVKSAMIGSFPYHRLSVYPLSLEEEIRRRGYIIDIDNVVDRMKRDQVGVLRELLRAEEKRLEVAEYLLDHLPWNFFMIVLNFADRVLHNLPLSLVTSAIEGSKGRTGLLDRFLHHRDRRTKEIVSKMFRLLDEFLHRCLRRLQGGLLIIASDHGMAERPKAFLVNTWLREMGYINYERTRALCYSTVMPLGLIRLNLRGRELEGVVPRSSYDEVLDEIEAGLRGLIDPETGRHIIKRVWRGDQLYGSEARGNPPDLVFEVENGYTVDPWRLEDEMIVQASRLNDHEHYGAFLLHGWGKSGEKMEISEIHGIILEFLGLES